MSDDLFIIGCKNINYGSCLCTECDFAYGDNECKYYTKSKKTVLISKRSVFDGTI